MLFKEMGLSPEIMKGIKSLGFENATPIQEKVIPALLEKKQDIIGLAQTGTGKTAAFGLPSLEQIDTKAAYPQILVLSPTRELCLQIARDMESFSRYIDGIKIAAVYGGAAIDKQISALKNGANVIVATPGRIYDIIRRKKIDLSKVSTLVLDEADEMLKMGFREDVDAILEHTPVNKNTLLFSATMAPGILSITKNYMQSPLEITIGKKNSVAENLSHIYHTVQSRDRYNALKRVVDYYPEIYGIVFCRTRIETKDVASKLMGDGYNSEALHGDLSQAQRDYVMQKFREKNIRILVATDVAARGLDVNNLTHVINFNLPDDPEVYTHRTGRTGRAGKEGVAVSIISQREKNKIFQLERVINKKFENKLIPGKKEICERQLVKLIDKLKNSPVGHNQLHDYMAEANDLLKDLSKEEIIERFVSLEFNRILDYYKNAPDLNVSEKPSKRRERSKPENRKRNGKGSGKNMSRILFNVGKGKNITKLEIIKLCVGAPGARNSEIGQIEIFKRAFAVEVEKKLANSIIKELNGSSHKGISFNQRESRQ